MSQLRQQYPDVPLQVWAEDEHRIGLQPVIRSVWVPKGYAPIATVKPRYQWLWLVGFVEPFRANL
ncbi:MAG: hypothetical protein AAF685_18480 [Cyanobacteria bacterium P01_C01_bin.89]